MWPRQHVPLAASPIIRPLLILTVAGLVGVMGFRPA